MSIGNVIAMLGAGMGGYLKGRQQKIDEDQATSDAEYRDWQRQQVKDQAARDAALRGDVAAAGAPVTTTQSGGRPDTMDDVDVGQAGEQPVAPNTYTVGGQSFNDQGQAQQAAAAANAPAAQAQRISQAYLKNGQAGMAFQVQRDAQQSELASLGLQQKHLEVANEQFDNLLQQQGSHDALADFVSSSAHDGESGALKIKAVPSADGKTVTYNRVSDDGTLTPTGHTYSNDQAGLQQAQLWLSRATPLATKISNLHQQYVDQQAAKKEDSEATLRAAQAKYYDGLLEVKKGANDAKAAGKTPLFDRMDESDKLELQNAYKASTEVDGLINKGMADGSLTKDGDNYKFLVARKAAADLKARSVLARYADSSAPATADPLGLRGGGAPGGGMTGAAAQAAADTDAGTLIINNEFGGDLAKAQAYVTARRAEAAKVNGDARQIMNSEADRIQRGIDAKKAAPASAATAALGAPAPAEPGQRRVAQTAVVDFSGPKGAGVNAHVSAAASRIPALTAAVADAKANLDAAKSKGPMAVAAARDKWNNAKTALAEANLRAGNTVAEEDN